MSRGIFDDNFVAHVHTYAGSVPFAEMRLIPTQAGPAGHATVKLSEAIEVEVDFAQVNVLTGINVLAYGQAQTAPALDGSDITLLEELLGDDRAQQAVQVLTADSSRPVRIMASSEDQQMTSLPMRGSAVGRRFGRAAALVDIAHDVRETMVVRAVAALEAAVVASDVDSPAIARALAAQASSALVDLDEEDAATSDDLASLRQDVRELVERDPKIAFMVHDVIDRAQPLLAARAAGVAAFVREVLTEATDAMGDGPLNDLVDSWRISHAEQVSTNFSLKSMIIEERLPMFDSSRTGRWQMFWDEHPGGSWVRILDPDDQSLIGLVPVRKVKRNWEAEAIVPTTRPMHQWIIEVTDMPIPPQGKLSVRNIVEAIQLGRAAALRSATAGRRGGVTVDAWLACAEAWKSAGDREREMRARAYADEPFIDRPVFLADRVRRTLHLEMP